MKQLNSVLHWIRQKSPVERKSPNQEIPTILRLYWNWVLFWSKHHSFTFYYFSPIYSRLSLALMEDSGWYIPDYSLGRIFWDVYRDLSRGGINLYDIPLVWGGGIESPPSGILLQKMLLWELKNWETHLKINIRPEVRFNKQQEVVELRKR